MNSVKGRYWYLSLIVGVWLITGCLLANFSGLVYGHTQTFVTSCSVWFVALSTILAVFFGFHNSRDNITFRINEATIRIIRDYDSERYILAKREIRKYLEEDKPFKTELVVNLDSNLDLKDSVISLSNYWEELRFSLKYKLVNRQMVIECLGDAVKQQITALRPWFDQRVLKANEKHENVVYKHLNHLEELLLLLEA